MATPPGHVLEKIQYTYIAQFLSAMKIYGAFIVGVAL